MTTQPRRDITVRCAEDEEWVALTPRNVWNPAHWINMASQEFERVFNIRFIPFTTVSWISNPPPVGNPPIQTLLEVFRQQINAVPHGSLNIVAAFTNHNVACNFIGYADARLGNNIIHRPHPQLQMRNLVIHELSHIMGCTCNNMAGINYHPLTCFMGHLNNLGSFNHWCQTCINTINTNRNRLFPSGVSEFPIGLAAPIQ